MGSIPKRSGPSGRRGRRRVAAGGLTVLVGAGLLTACSSGDDGPPTLTWYINPDSGGQVEIAARCTEAADGRYTIETQQLPRESQEQRQQLVRRLAANDSSVDIMSLDPPYIPEFAEANFLAPVPDDVAERVTEGVVESAVQGASWQDELVSVPFWANTQLLWYKRDVAEAAGLNMSEPVTWEQIIEAAESQDTAIAVQGRRSESLTVWVNALVESAGGSIITETDPDEPSQVTLGLEDTAGEEAAQVMREISDAGIAGAAFTTSGEDENVASFENGDAGFMVNWPFVWQRAIGNLDTGLQTQEQIDDYGWALYPQVVEGEPSAPPYGGINLAVGAFTEDPDMAYEATECITSDENQAYYFTTNGNPASSEAVYEMPEVQEVFPMAGTIRESLNQAAPRPQTAFYSEVSEGIQREYHPPTGVGPETGRDADELITAVLNKEQLL